MRRRRGGGVRSESESFVHAGSLYVCLYAGHSLVFTSQGTSQRASYI